MKTEVHVLGSGSAGNLVVLRCDDQLLLVDIGFSAKETERRLTAADLAVAGITGILITHEHEDHVRGLRVFADRHELPAYMNALTAERLHVLKKAPNEVHIFPNGVEFTIGAFRVDPFSVCHDAVDPVGYRLGCNGTTVAVATDLGYLGKLVPRKLSGADVILLESNYDPDLLQRCKRPPRVIHRIRSKRGHLDNQTSLTCVAESATAKTQHVIFTHLSDECNDPALVEAMAKELLPAHLTVHVANQHEPVTARLKAAE